MYPFSYTSLKVIHDEKIQSALAHQHLDAGQATQRRGLLQALKKFLARFNHHRAGNKLELPSGCAETTSFLTAASCVSE